MSINYYDLSLDPSIFEKLNEYLHTVPLTDFSIRLKTEERFKNYFNCKKAILVNSGTTALYLSMLAIKQLLNKDITDNDISIIGPAYGHPAWIQAARLAGYKLQFCDVKENTLSMNPDILIDSINDTTKVVLFIDKAGYIGEDLFKVKDICNKHNLFLIEDSCNALGHRYNDIYAGTIGDFGTFSFSNPKTITCGEGGLVISNREDVNGILDDLQYEGGWYNYHRNKDKTFINMGGNFNLCPQNCFIVNEQIGLIEDYLHKQLDIYNKYVSKSISLINFGNNYKYCPSINITINKNANKMHDLYNKMNIRTLYKHYKNMSKFFTSNRYPVADRLEEEVLMLPKSFNLTDKDINAIVSIYKVFMKGG